MPTSHRVQQLHFGNGSCGNDIVSTCLILSYSLSLSLYRRWLRAIVSFASFVYIFAFICLHSVLRFRPEKCSQPLKHSSSWLCTHSNSRKLHALQQAQVRWICLAVHLKTTTLPMQTTTIHYLFSVLLCALSRSLFRKCETFTN